MYNLNCVIVVVFNCTHAYAWGYILVDIKAKTSCRSAWDSAKWHILNLGFHLNNDYIYVKILVHWMCL